MTLGSFIHLILRGAILEPCVKRRSALCGSLPKDLAATIKRCWPRGIVEEFSADESYFQEIRHQIEGDLGSISGASLVWQTEEARPAGWEDDNPDEPPFHDSKFQSYHLFFVLPNGEEFRFEDETIGDDPENGTQTTYAGEGQFGVALTISLAAPVAATPRLIRSSKTAQWHARI